MAQLHVDRWERLLKKLFVWFKHNYFMPNGSRSQPREQQQKQQQPTKDFAGQQKGFPGLMTRFGKKLLMDPKCKGCNGYPTCPTGELHPPGKDWCLVCALVMQR